MKSRYLEVVTGDGIEPSKRGFSRQLKSLFDTSNPKKRDEFSRVQPNRHRRPSPCRTPTGGRPPERRRVAHAGQRVGRIGTERGPNYVSLAADGAGLRRRNLKASRSKAPLEITRTSSLHGTGWHSPKGQSTPAAARMPWPGALAGDLWDEREFAAQCGAADMLRRDDAPAIPLHSSRKGEGAA
jgi:hypothetical protein